MDISVIVPTHDRSDLLEGTLESLSHQSLDPERYEVLIVDNASPTNATQKVAERWLRKDGFRGRYVREEVLGANAARNRGVAEARGEILAFIDDDARAYPDWLESLLRSFGTGDASGVGGKIELLWEVPPPDWLHRNHLGLLAEFDLGNERKRVDRYPYLVSANLAFTADTLRRFGGFHLDLGRCGTSLISMDETELCFRIVKGGGLLFYEPMAVVKHFVPRERTRLSFLLRRSYAQGRSVCRYQRISGARDRTPSRPMSVVRTVASLPPRVLRRDWREAAGVLTTLVWHFGYLREARAR
jgi:glycosyltransferase involved in cell wall biosynthesis